MQAARTTMPLPHVCPPPSPRPQNDVHNRIQSQDAGSSHCSATEDVAGRCFGGYARIAAVLQAARLKDPGGGVQ